MFRLQTVPKSEQNSSDFRHCLKSKPFGNGTIMQMSEIRMFGFQTFTVLVKLSCSQQWNNKLAFINLKVKFDIWYKPECFLLLLWTSFFGVGLATGGSFEVDLFNGWFSTLGLAGLGLTSLGLLVVGVECFESESLILIADFGFERVWAEPFAGSTFWLCCSW